MDGHDDIFAELHEVEHTSFARGAADGRRDGLVAGIREGRELGVQKGYEIGVELGFYAGCVRTWRALQSLEECHHRRAQQQTSAPSSGGEAPGAVIDLHATSPAQQPDPSADLAAAATDAIQGIHLNEPAASSQHTSISSPPAAKQKGSTSLLIPERAEKALTVLEQLLKDFPLTNPQDEQLHELLERIRGRFKVVASMMGLLHDYMPREADREAGNAGASSAGGAGSLSF